MTPGAVFTIGNRKGGRDGYQEIFTTKAVPAGEWFHVAAVRSDSTLAIFVNAMALFRPRQFSSRSEVDWAALLPAENVTRWLAVDGDSKRLQIEPSAAVPDPE